MLFGEDSRVSERRQNEKRQGSSLNPLDIDIEIFNLTLSISLIFLSEILVLYLELYVSIFCRQI